MRTTKPILLLEDDLVDQEAVSMALEELKVINKIEACSNGEEGLEYLKHQLPVIILLDLNMPKMDGFDFLKVVKNDKNFKRIPVIVFTTSSEERDKVESYNLGVAGYIVKPSSHEKFVEVLHALDVYWTISELPQS